MIKKSEVLGLLEETIEMLHMEHARHMNSGDEVKTRCSIKAISELRMLLTQIE